MSLREEVLFLGSFYTPLAFIYKTYPFWSRQGNNLAVCVAHVTRTALELRILAGLQTRTKDGAAEASGLKTVRSRVS